MDEIDLFGTKVPNKSATVNAKLKISYRVKMSNPKESENRNGKGGTICRGVKDARIKMPDKNFLCRQLGFDRHMHEDELEEQDLFETNWQNTGIC